MHGHPEGAFPVGVLLAAERGHRAVGPGVHVRAVVGRVDDDRIVGDAQILERLEQLADVPGRARSSRRRTRLPRGTAPARRDGSARTCVQTVHPRRVHPDRRTACRPRPAVLMKSTAASEVSSSIVSMRLRVSGPVSSIVCLPTRPQRGCSVGSSVSARLRSAARRAGRTARRHSCWSSAGS